MKNVVSLMKNEIQNYMKNPSILALVFLPIFMSKIITKSMELSGQDIFLLSIWILFAQVMVGIMLTGPNLIEEREAKTIDALLCSPLSFGQIICAKGIAILILSMFSQICVYLINEGFQPELLLLLIPMFLGGILFILIGTVIGLKVKSSQSGSAVSAFVMVVLFLIVSVYQLLPKWSYKFVLLIPSISVTEVINELMSVKGLLLYQSSIVITWLFLFCIVISLIGRKWTH
ncbi:ABC transporter permease [Lachnoclostridium phytofermentans]|uniref:ABC transporter permease n=1 Tax=Lachnoclostridium phytofermentans TaxID=66219 RepID=UPI0004969DAF|nr:ABC transporter permease [Lachnoclostridium phytofermentans]